SPRPVIRWHRLHPKLATSPKPLLIALSNASLKRLLHVSGRRRDRLMRPAPRGNPGRMTKWLREIAVATVVGFVSRNAGVREGRANSPVVGQLGVIQLPVCLRSGKLRA